MLLWTNFGSKFSQKSEHHSWILHIWINLSTKFQVVLKILIFWTKLAQKGHFQFKIAKLNMTIEFCTFDVPNFSLGWQFWFSRLNLPKKGISVLKQKSEHHHGILHIQIRLGTKYQLIKLTILIFLDQKEFFWTKKSISGQK